MLGVFAVSAEKRTDIDIAHRSARWDVGFVPNGLVSLSEALDQDTTYPRSGRCKALFPALACGSSLGRVCGEQMCPRWLHCH